MWPKPKPRSTGWQQRPATTVWPFVTSGSYRCALCWRGRAATPPPIRSPGIATATWRIHLASKVTSTGPKRCNDNYGIGLWVVWDRAPPKCEVLFRVRYAGVDGHESCGVQAGHGAVRRCRSFDGHRGNGGVHEL